MLTFLAFVNFEMNQAIIVQMYKDGFECGRDIPAKIKMYFPDGQPDRLYTVCLETGIVATSVIPRLRGS